MYYLEIDLEECDGCGICVAVCPHNASFDIVTRGGKGFTSQKVFIGVKGGSSAVIGEHITSEFCGECILNCPQQAISLVAPPTGEGIRVIHLEEEIKAEEITLEEQEVQIDLDQFDMKRASVLKDALVQLRERYKERKVRQALSRGKLDQAEQLLKEK